MKPPLPHFPQPPGRCFRCGQTLLDSRGASIELIQGKHRLVCRAEPECRERRQRAREEAAHRHEERQP